MEGQEQVEQQEEQTVSKADYDKLLAQSRKWERQSKASAEKAKAYDEMQAKSMTGSERAEAASKRADEAEAELAKYRRAEERSAWAAKAHESTGVPVDVLQAMEAGSEKEMMARAESLKGYFAKRQVVPGDGVHLEGTGDGESANDWLRSTIPTH